MVYSTTLDMCLVTRQPNEMKAVWALIVSSSVLLLQFYHCV